MHKRFEYRAAVSLITVIMLSILLTLITTGFVRLMVTYQRESTNDDLSNRAYYAAQAGFEDASRLINKTVVNNDIMDNYNGNKDDCAPYSLVGDGSKSVSPIKVAGADSGIDASYTCEMINLKPDSQSYDNLAVNKAMLFPVTPRGTGISQYYLHVTWSPGANPNKETGKSLPPVQYWQDPSGATTGAPAMMRVNILWASSDSLSSMKSSAFYLNPSADQDKNLVDSSPAINLASSATGLPADPTINVKCEGPPLNQCKGTIKLEEFSSQQVFAVLRPIYQPVDSMSVSISGGPNGSNPIDFTSGQASIDITGKAGNVYRRIKQNVPYGKFKATSLGSVSDFGLVAGDGLCKQISLSSDASSFSNGCD